MLKASSLKRPTQYSSGLCNENYSLIVFLLFIVKVASISEHGMQDGTTNCIG